MKRLVIPKTISNSVGAISRGNERTPRWGGKGCPFTQFGLTTNNKTSHLSCVPRLENVRRIRSRFCFLCLCPSYSCRSTSRLPWFRRQREYPTQLRLSTVSFRRRLCLVSLHSSIAPVYFLTFLQCLSSVAGRE